MRVILERADPTDACSVVWAVDPNDSSSAQWEQDKLESTAALAGVTDAVDQLTRLGVATSGWIVRLVWLGMNSVDTEPTAVHAAACVATADAFGAVDSFRIVYDKGWRCEVDDST